MTIAQSGDRSIPLPGPERWSLWPWALIRSTGFPLEWIRRLADEDLARASERSLTAERAVAALRSQFEAHFGLPLPSHRGKAERTITKVLSAPAKDQAKDQASESPVSLDQWREALAERERCQTAYQRAFENAWRETRSALREIAADERFCEAMAWQNHRGYRTGIARMAGYSVDTDNKKTRKIEQLAVKYAQRYVVRNDTIGFYGPICWGLVADQGEALEHEPGDQLVGERAAFFEDWAITELCRTLDAHNAELRPWLRPRRLPVVGLVGRDAYLMMPKPMTLEPIEARVLSLCDGHIRAKDLAAHLIADDESGMDDEASVYAIIDGLCKRGLAMWRVEVIMSLHGDELLRELLMGVEDDELRERCLAPLDQMRAALKRAEAARGPDEVLAALENLDQIFERVTDKESVRNAGKQYATRTLAAFDTQRTDRIQFGPGLTHALTPVLDVFMPAARWFTSEVGRTYRVELARLYQQLRTQMKTDEVPLLRLWLAAQKLFPVKRGLAPPALLQPVLDETVARWQRVFELPPAGTARTMARRVDRSSQELASRVAEAFPDTAVGWSLARHHGVDIMIAAADVDAIQRGEFQIVIGEFHCAMNTSIGSCMIEHHPRAEDLYRLWENDFPHACVIPAVPRNVVPARMNRELATSKDYRLEWSPEIAGPPSARNLSAGDLVAIMRPRPDPGPDPRPDSDGDGDDGDLVICTRDGSRVFDVLEFFGQALSNVCASYFKLPSTGAHTPRIAIDQVIIHRETWKFQAGDLDFVAAKTPEERFAGAHAWRASHDMPRYAFFRTALELKPIYLDFESPLLVELFCQLGRAAARHAPDSRISVSEMSPAHGEIWLADKRGHRYANEVRLVAVDPATPDTLVESR